MKDGAKELRAAVFWMEGRRAETQAAMEPLRMYLWPTMSPDNYERCAAEHAKVAEAIGKTPLHADESGIFQLVYSKTRDQVDRPAGEILREFMHALR